MQEKVQMFVSEWNKSNDEQKMKMLNELSFKGTEESKFALDVYKFIMKDAVKLLSEKAKKNHG